MAAADAGVTGRWKPLLEFAPILYIGRISYGIYLYHLFVKYVVQVSLQSLGVDLPNRGVGTFVIVAGLTVVIASLSWFAIERPLASWKRKFTYSDARTTKTIA